MNATDRDFIWHKQQNKVKTKLTVNFWKCPFLLDITSLLAFGWMVLARFLDPLNGDSVEDIKIKYLWR